MVVAVEADKIGMRVRIDESRANVVVRNLTLPCGCGRAEIANGSDNAINDSDIGSHWCGAAAVDELANRAGSHRNA